jgi:cation transport ATPase
MNFASLRTSLFVVGFLALGLRIARLIVPGEFPDGVAFAVAAIALFRFGFPLQVHAVANLKRFRITLRTLIWFATAVAFWYSTIIWIWWSRRTPTFPLFLLNARLRTTLFFDVVPFLVFAGLALELRSRGRNGSHRPDKVRP